MNKRGDLFSWLVEYHCTENLEQCRPYMIEGRVYHLGSFVEEGDENELYKGLLIVANGSTLVDKLSDGHVINDDPLRLRYTDIQGKEDLWKYVNERRNKDGAYIFDGVNQRITKAAEVNNNPSTLTQRVDLASMVPGDFVYADGREFDESEDLGTKTRLAIKMPLAYGDTNAYQIKRTAYGNTGMGKVTHFGSQGLVEEAFFRYSPTSEGPFIVPEQGIIGIHRQYQRDENNKLILASEQIIDPNSFYRK
ncbi:MAG: hypothetical protein Q8R37_01705 [Nanoarchaeota archaeon]|nr:hypothetical protein [Nanoarchaeota archaeon]